MDGHHHHHRPLHNRRPRHFTLTEKIYILFITIYTIFVISETVFMVYYIFSQRKMSQNWYTLILSALFAISATLPIVGVIRKNSRVINSFSFLILMFGILFLSRLFTDHEPGQQWPQTPLVQLEELLLISSPFVFAFAGFCVAKEYSRANLELNLELTEEHGFCDADQLA